MVEVPIFEPGLDTLVKKNIETKNLIFSSDIESITK